MGLREEAIASGFNPADIDLAEWFVRVVADLLEQDRRHAAPIKRGIDRMAKLLNSQVPALEEGKPVGLGTDDVREAMDPIRDEQVLHEFVGGGGTIMLESQDGPMGAAVHMKSVVDELLEHQERGGQT